jgi:hypothetical protein
MLWPTLLGGILLFWMGRSLWPRAKNRGQKIGLGLAAVIVGIPGMVER